MNTSDHKRYARIERERRARLTLARSSLRNETGSTRHGCPQEEDFQVKKPEPSGIRVAPGDPGAQRVPSVWLGKDPARRVWRLWLVRRSTSH